MRMIIEGPRNCGKTYLCDKLSRDVDTFKYKFSDFYEDLKMQDIICKPLTDPDWHYFSLGKDTMLLETLRTGAFDDTHNWFIDRSFLSSVVYSVICKRIALESAELYTNYIQKKYGSMFNTTPILLIHGQNPKERGTKDAWDIYNHAYTEAMHLYTYLLNKYQIKYLGFENDYTDESVKRFTELISKITKAGSIDNV